MIFHSYVKLPEGKLELTYWYQYHKADVAGNLASSKLYKGPTKQQMCMHSFINLTCALNSVTIHHHQTCRYALPITLW